MVSKKQNNNRREFNKKWAIISLITIILLAGIGYWYRKELSVFGFNAVLKKEVKTTLDKSYKPVGQESKMPKLEVSEPFSLLLLGIDQREEEPSRSDSIIYSVIRPKDDKILLLSIRGTANILTIIYAKPSDVPGLAFFLTLSPIVRATPPGLPITHLPVVSAVVMS